MPELLPLFLNLTGRDVLLVGGGRVAEAKLRQLLAAGARVRVVAPAVVDGIRAADVAIDERGFEAADLEGAWLVVAAATPDVNRAVADAAEALRIFVNAVDDPANATAFLSGVVRRDGVTLAISTSGDAPALTSLLRESLDAVLPADLAAWVDTAREERVAWRRDAVPMDERKPLLLRALNAIYDDARPDGARLEPRAPSGSVEPSEGTERERAAERPAMQCVPWLSGPEDSWL
jgi:uroporphyrin-III C-methyltransferase/precorrin-2 dehydrogenase/sirohydrochlorin ferrochelatase